MSDSAQLYDDLRAAMHRGDGSVFAKFHPDFVAYEDPGMPYGGVVHGGEAFMELREKVYTIWGPKPLQLQFRCSDDEGHVIVLFKLVGRPNGQEEVIETYASLAWTFVDDLAVEARVIYYDTPRLAAAMAAA